MEPTAAPGQGARPGSQGWAGPAVGAPALPSCLRQPCLSVGALLRASAPLHLPPSLWHGAAPPSSWVSTAWYSRGLGLAVCRRHRHLASLRPLQQSSGGPQKLVRISVDRTKAGPLHSSFDGALLERGRLEGAVAKADQEAP